MKTSSSSTKGPIFIVGSPRSGTSILTWCLGQHPNILGLEESNWMTSFAIDIAVAAKRGSARGERSQLSSMGMSCEHLMRDLGRTLNRSILTHRAKFERRRWEEARRDQSEVHAAFQITRAASDSKSRWVNGTPEYSFGIGGLRKLFPSARFIHLLRNCDDAVRSMIHFERVAGTKLVADEEQGYDYWLRSVRACREAEEAYGSAIVYRLHYDDLVNQPEPAIRAILDFLGEPFTPDSLEPLEERINSSRVSGDAPGSGPLADLAAAREARELWTELLKTRMPLTPSSTAAQRVERSFEERVEFMADLSRSYKHAQEVNKALQKEQAAESAFKNSIIVDLQEEFKTRTEWALALEAESARKDSIIVALQEEFKARTEWALALDAESARKDSVVEDLRVRLKKLKAASRGQAGFVRIFGRIYYKRSFK